ncbi:hypothetical protein [Leucobacter sp. wl10]|uniref:hypothetical protein n=1 Tax=Leucobacter sp. wl10 TaxID=2304677 RepID=UPI000E5A9985|nr:hypothetical protein [Leucobacter sp. wl10]RGE23247.1 hypothetical protein D1J51_03170 [Leucobacter sp. wl10]
MPTKLKPQEWRALNAELVPLVAAWIDRHSDVLSEKGRKFADRAMEKANLAGETGTRILFEPVILIAAAAEPLDIDELYAVCDRIPFTGDFFQWNSVGNVYAAAVRIYARAGEPDRAAYPLQMIAYPENGEKLADPFAAGKQATLNRANGGILGGLPRYPRPATTIPALQHLISAIAEWIYIWAYDRSTEWPHQRLDDAIEEAVREAGAYLA